ncbi:hypothetical protein DY000_02000468 [Brassica cretica]|uniref:Peptidase S26 domain-containing protein n=1 Tax=Brassica cretica TaxID=69181 RepID=A0ABQ7BT99_BRACR|nr:hypothetical protein DY000_02000468 [Brassica cretica]
MSPSLSQMQPHRTTTLQTTATMGGASFALLNLTARSTVQECGFARLSRYYVTVASPSHYAVSSIDGSSQSWICGTSTSLVAGTIVQECKLTKSTSYSITSASSSHYVISNIDGSSQCQLRDLQTGAAIINGGSRMPFSSRTLTHRVFTGVLRPLFFRSRISPSAEALTTSCRLLHMTPLPPLSLVRLVSPSSPIYMARSPSVQATTITPQAVVTTFIFRLERLSTFSGELLESSPRLPPGVSMEGQTTPLPPTIQASSETWFKCSQNPLIGFFKVDFDVCAFLQMQALGLQVKFLFGISAETTLNLSSDPVSVKCTSSKSKLRAVSRVEYQLRVVFSVHSLLVLCLRLCLLLRPEIRYSRNEMAEVSKPMAWNGERSIRSSFNRRQVSLFASRHRPLHNLPQLTSVQGPSMLPTLNLTGDVILAEHVSHRFGKIGLGDVVLVRSPTDPMKMVTKRVLGLEGHRLSFYADPLVGDDSVNVVVAISTFKVPKGHVWIQGDNVHASTDSRNFGPVPYNLIEGKALLRVWPPRCFGSLR